MRVNFKFKEEFNGYQRKTELITKLAGCLSERFGTNSEQINQVIN